MTESKKALSRAGQFSEMSLLETANRLRRGETTSLEITEQSIEAAQTYGAELNCFVTVDVQGSRAAAACADAEMAAGLDRGPLHGIPVGVKDLIATSGLRTTMGSRHFADHVPNADADVVTSLRRAGAVILGKTHLHEFAYGATGDRAATGPALNPLDTSLMTGGSSSGSAAAVAAGIVPIALGTDTVGSIRIPAALCGVVGLRPTSGILSATGVFPLTPTLDVIGPLAGSVSDAAVAWWALSARPSYSGALLPEWSQQLFRAAADPETLRIGVLRDPLVDRVEKHQADALAIAMSALGSVGAALSDITIPELGECEPARLAIEYAEAVDIHKDRIDSDPDLFEPEILEQFRAASSILGWEYVRAIRNSRRLRTQIMAQLDSVDSLILPTVPIEAPKVGQRTLSGTSGWPTPRKALLSLTSQWSLLDFPAISIPVPVPGRRLPGAVQIVGKPGREWQLLATAAALEGTLSSL